jgi:cation-transporting P-type ATPase 13A2
VCTREQAESGLRFLGLVIFENKLKPGTAPAIQELRSAHLACRMITGDNPLTAVSVARECDLISQAAHVFSPSFARGSALLPCEKKKFPPQVTFFLFQGNSTTPLSKLIWSCMDDATWTLDSYTLKPMSPSPHHTVEDEINYQDYSLVITGDVFRWMLNYSPLETLQRVSSFHRLYPCDHN